MKKCSKCKELKNLDLFSCTKRKEDKSCLYYNSWCKYCRQLAEQQIRLNKGIKEKFKPNITSCTKQCTKCKLIYQLSEFSPSKRGRLGLSSYCKKCTPRGTKEDHREYTRKYREKHKERWRALHRLNMVKRLNNIENTSDGSVTDSFLKFVYAQEFCCWCKNFIEKSKRTLEHIIELTKGGLHSTNNITMACASCNSKRLNKKSEIPLVKSLHDKFEKENNDLPKS